MLMEHRGVTSDWRWSIPTCSRHLSSSGGGASSSGWTTTLNRLQMACDHFLLPCSYFLLQAAPARCGVMQSELMHSANHKQAPVVHQSCRPPAEGGWSSSFITLVEVWPLCSISSEPLHLWLLWAPGRRSGAVL